MFNYLVEKIHNIVLPFYQEEGRFFHNEEHLKTGLYLLEKLQLDGYIVQDIHYAAWLFHDIIYDVSRSDNEKLSAECFESFNAKYELGFDKKEIEIVKTIILDTKKHIATINESKIIMDIDMSVLGESYDSFLEYRKNIKKEYALIYSEAEINKGTKVFFESVLKEQKNIFNTEYFETYEEKAKNNIQKYLENI